MRLVIFATTRSFRGSFGHFSKNKEGTGALDIDPMSFLGGSLGSKICCGRLRWMRIRSLLG